MWKELILAFKLHIVKKIHAHAQGFLTLRKHQADAMPRYGRLAHLACGKAAFKLKQLVTLLDGDGRLAEVVGLFDDLGLCKSRHE